MSKINDFLHYQLGNGVFFDNTKAPSFCDAIHEMNMGQKKSNWAWYIMPTNNKSKTFGYKFALNDEETITYLKNPTLYFNYFAFIKIINNQLNKGIPSLQLLATKKDIIKLYESVSWFKKFLKKDEQLFTIIYEIIVKLEPEMKYYMLDYIIDFQIVNNQRTKYLTKVFNEQQNEKWVLI